MVNIFTENFADFFGLYFAYATETVMGYDLFGKLLGRKFNVFEHIVFIICGFCVSALVKDNLPVNSVLYVVLMVCAGKIFSERGFNDIVTAAVFVHMIFQMSFTFTGIVICTLFSAEDGAALISGNAAMIVGEALSLCICRIAGKRAEKYFGNSRKRRGMFVFSVIIILAATGDFFNHLILGSTVSDKADLDIAYIYIAAILAAGCICAKLTLDADLALCFYKAASLRQEEENRLIYEKTRTLRHDVKNHLAVVRGLCASGNAVAAAKYAAELNEEYKVILKNRTGSEAADILLTEKMTKAEENHIRTKCDIHFPKNFIADMDMCVILSNAADNSINACMKINGEKHIDICGRVSGNFFILEFENSFDGNGNIKKGTGLENIERTVKKYGGSLDISLSDNIFALTVVFDISRCERLITRKSY